MLTELNDIQMFADFRFHPVGHGLFYSGEIHLPGTKGNPITFVYDCGGTKVADRFEKFWNPYRGAGGRLDLLVVSHFHFDHIKGVPNLIKAAKPRSVVLPYLCQAEKIAYVASLSAEQDLEATPGELEEAGKFILDPETFCKSYCENQDCRIYYIRPDKKDGLMHENQGRQTQETGTRDLYIPDATPSDKKNDVFDVPNGSAGRIAGWEFRFFMPKEASFSDDFKTWMDNEGITTDKFKLGSGADDLYKKIKNKFAELSAHTDPNVSNVVCAHGPLEANGYLCEWDASAGGSCFNCWRGCGICPKMGNVERFADIQVLTGDAMFGNEIESEMEKYKDRCFLFQIPHHGSKNGWQDWFNELTNCKLRPVTHRWDCTYRGKPFMTDISNLVAACHVTECPMSALILRMFVHDRGAD